MFGMGTLKVRGTVCASVRKLRRKIRTDDPD